MGESIRVGPHPSGWDFEHYHSGNGNWTVQAQSPRGHYLGQDYQKTPDNKIKFEKYNLEDNRQQDPEGTSIMRQHVLDLHEAEEVPQEKRPRTVYYHGTSVKGVTHILPAAHIGKEPLYHETDPNHAYATTSLEDAWHHAGNAAGETERPRVYQVRPIGGHKHVERDPEYYPDGSSRDGVMEGDHRSPKGFEVVREMKPSSEIRKAYRDQWGED